MGFLKSLFGADKSAQVPIVKKQPIGKEYAMIDLLRECSHLEKIQTQEHLGESQRRRCAWTPHKHKEFVQQFVAEKFVFNGEIKSMEIFQFLVERDLTGHIDAALYSESKEEYKDYEEKWGESPKTVGFLTLSFENGKAEIKVW